MILSCIPVTRHNPVLVRSSYTNQNTFLGNRARRFIAAHI